MSGSQQAFRMAKEIENEPNYILNRESVHEIYMKSRINS